MSFPNRNALWARALVHELAASGVAHACLSPGSRSTPLALACVECDALTTSVHHDERGAAFFALGLARASGKPVLLVCTSGTAAANYLPAIVEASLANVPLVVLTADRPPEARGWGAPQTIDQVGLYGSAVRWAVDLPTPEPTAPMLAFLGQTARRAVQVARSAPRGPVHLNVPLRDPLPPVRVPGDVPESIALPELAAPDVAVVRPSDDALRAAAAALAREPRGLIAVGPTDGTPELARALRDLAEACGYPLFAEASSSLRQAELRPQLVAHGELLARSAAFMRSHAPRAVVRLGHAPTTRALTRALDGAAYTLLIDEPGRWIDPAHRANAVLAGARAETLARLAERVRALQPACDPAWMLEFQRADEIAESSLTRALDADPELGELATARAIFDALPAEVPLYVASSMPIRDLESTAGARPSGARVLANRGANGIDGTVASAAGAAQASSGRAALLIGDVALLHDLNSLSLARTLGLQLTVLLVNNDGGGIFSFLEVAGAVPPATFERLWGTPHATDFASAARTFGGTHELARTRSELDRALVDALAPRAPGLRLIEVRTERAANVAAHERVFAAVGAALEAGTWRQSS